MIYTAKTTGAKNLSWNCKKPSRIIFFERTIYYSTFPISAQAKKGTWDYNLKAVYCIGILDFTFRDYTDEQEKREVVHTFTIKDQHNRQIYNKLTYINIEMPNFRKAEDELETSWISGCTSLKTWRISRPYRKYLKMK